MKNKFFNQCIENTISITSPIRKFPSSFSKYFILILVFGFSPSILFAQDDVEYDVLDQQAELKRVCWPQVSTSKTEASTNKMTTDTIPFPVMSPMGPSGGISPFSGGLSTTRRLYNAVEIPNSFPLPDTAEIFDLLGHPLVINGDTIRFFPDNTPVNNVASIANSILPAQPNYHWVGYISNPFQPDRVAEYYYNIFHRWYSGMPCHYESFGGRQWNSDNTAFSNYADTVFQPYPVFASIVQSITCYGGNNGIIKFNTNPLNYYTYSINGGTPTLNNTFSNLSAGTYTLSIKDSFANICDTVITLAQPPSTGTSTTVTNCGPFTWNKNGVTYNTSGVYFFTSTTAVSCPQQDTLILNVTSSSTTNTSITAYNSYTWPTNGLTYTSSGTYFYSSTVAGCVSNSVLNLTIINSSFNMNLIIDQPISCNGSHDGSIQAIAFPASVNFTYILDGGVAMNNTGFFANLGPGIHTVCVTNGVSPTPVCKTITLTQPLPLNATFVTDSLVSCFGNDGGVHVNINGGTTIIQPYLTFWTNNSGLLLNPSPNNHATFLTGLSAGLYHLTIEDDNGCTISLNYIMQSAPTLVVNGQADPIICNGGSTTIHATSTGGIQPIQYTVDGLPISSSFTAGTYTLTATDAQGCTATSLITLSEPDPITSFMSAKACNSYYWSMNGATYTATGYYVAFLSTINGCGITAILDLTINNNTNTTSNITACDSYYWSVNNSTYTTSGVYTATNLNLSGCVNTSTLNLVINNSSTSSTTATACNTYSWSVPGATNPYISSGIYTATHLNAAGCIQTDSLYLTINLNTSSTTNVVACNSYNWSVQGASNPYTSSGMYTATHLNIAGCTHTDSLYLTINQSTSNTFNMVACDSYTWNTPSGSSTYTISGTYTKTYLNAAGCVHTSILQLVIKNSTTSSTTISANNMFTWAANSTTYTISGIYTATLVNSVGCDSLLTLNLTINNTPVILNLRCFIQGYMIGPNNMKAVLANQFQPTTANACDTILVELHNPSPPYNTAYFTKTVMNQNGFSTCIFPSLAGSFYIVVRHRNALETWSANPITLGGNPANYNFTTGINQAYGANQIQVGASSWAFYSGDVNHDDNIDLYDIGFVEVDLGNFESGYFPTDVNGDGSVDLLDLPYVENNVLDFIYTEKP